MDVTSALASADPGATIYATAPHAPSSDAMVCAQGEIASAGFAYLLEVAVAEDVLSVWSSWRDGRQPTREQAANAIIYFAQQDAYQPVE